MDVIYVEDLEVYAYHGVNQAEKDMGQRFLISLQIFLNLSEAGKSDDLSKTINYAKLCCEVEEEFKREKYDLIEKSAESLANFILKKYIAVEKVTVKIKKPWAPIGKPLKWVAVEINRRWHTAYISIGSNLGDKEKNIKDAVDIIDSSPYNNVTKVSKLYETKPVGYLDQDNFLNGALEVKTLMEPEDLMDFLLEVEKKLKRERIIKWGPRTIDLDVILYDNLVTSEEKIILPHPRMHERLFVLKPLSDIAPYVIHPVLNDRIINLTHELEKTQEL
ncbi:2-amino-4-hydroxy-6-hydroxymethyldihydropteridine diphosphokinase [Clostridium autoethanogenum]|uniref:Bifunctional folate synthesis protein n=1 Tax=Clostridium autoethanogenum DSM 10061 TaxID=1341692 RepID=A0ABN4BLC6_9CLOT|nr:2-amino-4-hydroxy-6-hydroxymethyldihydropteridine diphosphokinase [Clostridium autoethanogenum]AGY76939.1 2-amino-4-hydroxy-6-hydroxymethyldihydropteridine diphosphokinase [Clostridium autoethanogenum DSM 10061]ALU37083.1 2-amino-4-hydroxy-6-hydroxymethyldihydropteridine pyrophosphokinase [Clostridium autoethanogenum DSM 10061]OVY48537.1 Bifunctional folate synthesis protein [Clostridium autoethanogenum]